MESWTDKFFTCEDLRIQMNEQKQKIDKEEYTYVNRNEVDLGVAVLARLGGGHVDDFAWATCNWRVRLG
jgi:hypothetical protein